MRSLKLKPPEIEESENAVVVRIRHERLASPEEMIVDYLKSNDEISNSVVRDLTGIGSENVVKGIFKRMIKSGEPRKRSLGARFVTPPTGCLPRTAIRSQRSLCA